MNILLNFSTQILGAVQTIMILAALVGSVFVFRITRKTSIIKIQGDTIEAMQQQIDALKEQNTAQQKKIDHQEFKLQAMEEALQDEGIFVTIDGEKVTIKDTRQPNTTKHIIRNPVKKTTTTAVVKKTEE
jgi:hypothetical protein